MFVDIDVVNEKAKCLLLDDRASGFLAHGDRLPTKFGSDIYVRYHHHGHQRARSSAAPGGKVGRAMSLPSSVRTKSSPFYSAALLMILMIRVFFLANRRPSSPREFQVLLLTRRILSCVSSHNGLLTMARPP